MPTKSAGGQRTEAELKRKMKAAYTAAFLIISNRAVLGTTPLCRQRILPFLNKINVGTPCTW